jgi:hypothetical protein
MPSPKPFATGAILLAFLVCLNPIVQAQAPLEYKLLATNRTSTMQKELNEAAALGYRFMGVMKGDTAFGGGEVVSILARNPDSATGRYEYKLLATQKTSTMQKELQEAGDLGFEYRGQTVGGEVIVILERDRTAPIVRYEYRLLATQKTSTMQKELAGAGTEGFEFVGVTVAETAFGGHEILTILRRRTER